MCGCGIVLTNQNETATLTIGNKNGRFALVLTYMWDKIQTTILHRFNTESNFFLCKLTVIILATWRVNMSIN